MKTSPIVTRATRKARFLKLKRDTHKSLIKLDVLFNEYKEGQIK